MFDIESIACPASLSQAIAALQADPQAIVIAGGTDVLIKIREGKYAGCRLVSIRDIPELQGISRDEAGHIHIGPLTTFSQLAASPLIMDNVPVLGRAADTVGGPQIRAMGTIGGNISNGVTSADTASTLLNLEAELTLEGPKGRRKLKVNDYYTGPGRVCLEPGELLTDICLRRENFQGWGGCYIKYAMRNAMDIATLGTSCLVRLLEAQPAVIQQVRLAFGVAAATPMRAYKTEAALAGLTLIQAQNLIAALVREEISPRTSWRASREFRLQIAGENAVRSLREAYIEAGGEV